MTGPGSPPAAPAPERVSLLEMLTHCDRELEDVAAWESVLKAEGKPLYKGMESRRRIMGGILRVLELVKMHEDAFREMVRKNKRPLPASDRKPKPEPEPEPVADELLPENEAP